MHTIQQIFRFEQKIDRKTAVFATTLLALIIFLSTLQLHINGSSHPYATDVGEIQNALPRWGTIHYNGYPLYTLTGSVFVTMLRWLGMAPAISASLYSALWGAASVALLLLLIMEFGAPPLAAALAGLLYALSTSIWVDSSIAEIHMMSMSLSFITLWWAVKFGRNGRQRDLYWLAFWGGQVLAHQRAFALFLPAILWWAWPHWRLVLRRLLPVLGLGLLGPLTYLYLPLRAWMGADWTYSSPGTWQGFWALVFYSRSDLVLVPDTPDLWLARMQGVLNLLKNDWPWPLMALGVVGLLLPGNHARWPEKIGLFTSWLLHLPVSFIVWEGYVSDALLAVKLPMIALAAVGLAFWSTALAQWTARAQKRPFLAQLSLLVWLLLAGWLFITNRPDVLAVTRADATFATIATAARIPDDPNRAQTLMALWGHDYWALAYAQKYEGAFPYLNLVDHDTNFAAVVARGDRLLTLSKTFYQRPPEWWAGVVGNPVYLAVAAPEIVEIKTEPEITAVSPATALFDLGNGLLIRSADVTRLSTGELLVTVDWQAAQADLPDYSIAVHLVAQDPPTGPQDILAQADRSAPVEGWYPTSHWQPGEVVRDQYLLSIPEGATAKAVRLSMYQVIDGAFVNSEWLSLP